MSKQIIELINKIQGVGTQAEKIKIIEAFTNRERQNAYYGLKSKIERKLKEYQQVSPATPLSVTGVISFINDL